MDRKSYRIAKIAEDMKDNYIELLEEGYKPDDIKKFIEDVQKDPQTTQTPAPKMSNEETCPHLTNASTDEDVEYLKGNEFGSQVVSKKAQDEVEEEPTEDDYIISDVGPLLSEIQVSQYGKVLGIFKTVEETETFIKIHMKKNNFFPGIWYQDDHGNLQPYSLENPRKIAFRKEVEYLKGSQQPLPFKQS